MVLPNKLNSKELVLEQTNTTEDGKFTIIDEFTRKQ
jgi:hypothetical protein